MIKLGTGIFLIWLVIFGFRIVAMGGIDLTARDSEFAAFKDLRESLTSTIQTISPNKTNSALLSGILLGERSSLPFYLKQDLQTTSTIHLVVVSGQNLTILGGFLMTLSPLIGRRKAIILTLISISFYSLLTGFQVPVIRSLVMASLVYSAQFFGKEVLGSWVLFITALFLLLINPNWLFSLSFQLSFLATFGVVIVSPILVRSLKVLPSLLKEDLSISVAAQLMTLPIIAANFNQISISGVVANILIGWTMPIILISGFVSLILGLVTPVLGTIVGLVPNILLTYFVYIVNFLADLPLSMVTVGATNILVWTGYYLILFGVLLKIKKPKTKDQKSDSILSFRKSMYS